MPDSHDVPQSAVIVGASRGIGLALCEALLSRAPDCQLIATARQASASSGLKELSDRYTNQLRVLDGDITRDEDIESLASVVKESGSKPDLVLIASGILHEEGARPEKALNQARREWMARQFEVNAISPILLCRALLPLMLKNGPTHLAALSAMVGSISDNRLGGWYGYRASKAALNQLLKTLAIEARRTHPDLCVTSIHPGTTDTALSRPFQGNVPEGKLYNPDTSAKRILDVVLSGKPQDSGRFMNWDGSTLSW